MLLLAIFPDINLQFSTSQCSFGSARPQNLDLRLDSMPGRSRMVQSVKNHKKARDPKVYYFFLEDFRTRPPPNGLSVFSRPEGISSPE